MSQHIRDHSYLIAIVYSLATVNFLIAMAPSTVKSKKTTDNTRLESIKYQTSIIMSTANINSYKKCNWNQGHVLT